MTDPLVTILDDEAEIRNLLRDALEEETPENVWLVRLCVASG